MKGSNKSRWAAVLVVAIVAGAAYWFWQGREAANSGAPTASGARQQGPGGGRPGRFGAALAPVQAATATSEAVPRYLSGLGTVTAANTVTVRSRVDGQLLAIHFTEGQQVKAGDLLAEIDPASLKLPSPRPKASWPRSGDPRQRPSRSGALPAAGQNQSGFPAGAGHPAVAGQRNPGYDQSGRSRRRQRPAAAGLEPHHRANRRPGRLKTGGYRQPIASGDTTGIVVLTQTHPIDVVFTLPENQIATVVQAQKAGKKLAVEAWDRTNKQKISEGSLLSLDNQIDATTGTIKLKARFTNLDDALFPNQFVNARMLVDTSRTRW